MASGKKKVKNKYTFAIFKRELPLHLMLLPGLILVAVFSYTPMAGLVIAFQKFIPSKGMWGWETSAMCSAFQALTRL